MQSWATTGQLIHPSSVAVVMKAFYLGRRGYGPTLRLQQAIFDQKIRRQVAVMRGESTAPLLLDVTLLVEHSEPVYTLGRRDTSEGLPWPCEIAVARTRRGGGITYHGPGQLAAYPVANIQRLWKGCATAGRPRSPIEWFSTVLEAAMVDVAGSYGVPTHPFKTGVWSDACEGRRPRKMGSVGLQLGSWVSMHGLGFNVEPDLRHFSHIVMCELPGEEATSLAVDMGLRGSMAPVPTVAEVSPLMLEAMGRGLAQTDAAYAVGPLVDLSEERDWEAAVLAASGFAALD